MDVVEPPEDESKGAEVAVNRARVGGEEGGTIGVTPSTEVVSGVVVWADVRFTIEDGSRVRVAGKRVDRMVRAT